MRTPWSFSLLALFCSASGYLTAQSTSPLLEEVWESAFIDGARIGSVHTTVHSVQRDGHQLLRTQSDLVLNFRRYDAKVKLRMEQGSEESLDGKIRNVFMRQYQDDRKRLELLGKVLPDEGRLHVVVDGGRIERRVRWKDDVSSLYRLDHLFEKRKPKVGDRFTVSMYEPTVNTVLDLHVRVDERETILLAGKPRKLLRVEMKPAELRTSDGPVKLPSLTWWLDNNFVPVRKKYELPGLGPIELIRTSKTGATAPAQPLAKTPDIGINALVPLNKKIRTPHATQSIHFRIHLKPGVDATTALVQDTHQEIVRVKDNLLEVVVHPVRSPEAKAGARFPGIEFIDSSMYLDVDALRILKLARHAVGDETDAWKKAVRIERWVRRNMRPDNVASLAPASEIAGSLRGDCRHYAFLTTALCRAEGIPARTAIGLLYVEKQGRPNLGFHMWTEVWIDGHWRGIDGTLGLGGVGATHLKITDHSWHKVRSLTPLLPLMQIVGKMSVEVVEVR